MAKTLLIGGSSAIASALRENTDREFISISRSEGTLDLDGDLNELDSIADIHGLVYFPGTINLKPFAMLKEEDFVNDFSVNVLGAVKVLKKVINQLKEADGDDDDAKIEIKKNKRILDSTQRLNEIKKLLYRGEYDVNWRSKEFPNHSALHQAAKFGHSDIIHHLLRAGWDVNRRNEYKQTPLMMAALFGNIRCTKVLLNMGAKMFIKDKTGFTAMGYCEKNIKQKKIKLKINLTLLLLIFYLVICSVGFYLVW